MSHADAGFLSTDSEPWELPKLKAGTWTTTSLKVAFITDLLHKLWIAEKGFVNKKIQDWKLFPGMSSSSDEELIVRNPYSACGNDERRSNRRPHLSRDQEAKNKALEEMKKARDSGGVHRVNVSLIMTHFHQTGLFTGRLHQMPFCPVQRTQDEDVSLFITY